MPVEGRVYFIPMADDRGPVRLRLQIKEIEAPESGTIPTQEERSRNEGCDFGQTNPICPVRASVIRNS
jgi:hypothetical protein